MCSKIYKYIVDRGSTVLYDDKDESPGSKLARAELIGHPVQIIVGTRGVKEGLIDIESSTQLGLRTFNDSDLGFEILSSPWIHNNGVGKCVEIIKKEPKTDRFIFLLMLMVLLIIVM